jgi:hypothetical protein
MSAAPIATLLLAALIGFPPTARGAEVVGVRAMGSSVRTLSRSDRTMALFVQQPSRDARFVQRVKWRARPKIVLGQNDHKVADEVDRGLAPVIVDVISSSPSARSPSAIAATSRLRC